MSTCFLLSIFAHCCLFACLCAVASRNFAHRGSVAEYWPQATAIRGQPSPAITVTLITCAQSEPLLLWPAVWLPVEPIVGAPLRMRRPFPPPWRICPLA